jgi:polyhydroxybutyrate depolymerase
MTRKPLLLAALLVLCLSACGSTPPAKDPVPSPGLPGETVIVPLGERPFQLHVPTSYAAGAKAPLVVLLHGYTSSADQQERYFGLTAESDRRGFLYAMPDGTTDSQGKRFWNATEACCDIDRSGVDDSGYLRQVIETVKATYAVDPTRVYLVGHSNGGFMAYRMACDHADEITAVVSLAGAATADPAQCKPARPVSVLQIHGTADPTINVKGGKNGVYPYPSAADTVALWRRLDGCADQPSAAEKLDLEAALDGAETTKTAYTSCRAGTRVAFWTIAGGKHVPLLSAGFAPAITDFLLSQVANS